MRSKNKWTNLCKKWIWGQTHCQHSSDGVVLCLQCAQGLSFLFFFNSGNPFTNLVTHVLAFTAGKHFTHPKRDISLAFFPVFYTVSIFPAEKLRKPNHFAIFFSRSFSSLVTTHLWNAPPLVMRWWREAHRSSYAVPWILITVHKRHQNPLSLARPAWKDNRCRWFPGTVTNCKPDYRLLQFTGP